MTANWSRNQWIYNKHLGWEKNDRMRINPYYENLIKRVIELSVDDIWEGAVQEWEIVDCEIDESMSQACVCGKDRLKYLFTIRNFKNGNILYPIGSTCINKFGRADLDYEISVYEDMFKLMRAVENREYIELTSQYFSKNLLRYLYENGVFKASAYNHYNTRNDLDFLLEMFHKRNKDSIYEVQQKKINAIIATCIIPFLRSKIKVRQGKITQTCPKCGAALKIRIAKTGSNPGNKFWGCANYPNCRYTKNIN